MVLYPVPMVVLSSTRESPTSTHFQAERKRRKMFGTLTLIKRNGSEGSTMTMDSRETTIGR